MFLSWHWAMIGPKYAFAEITGICVQALVHVEPLDRRQRLSWAARWETTSAEDQAYSLLGIFDINMPTLYGEGNRAFNGKGVDKLTVNVDLGLAAKGSAGGSSPSPVWWSCS